MRKKNKVYKSLLKHVIVGKSLYRSRVDHKKYPTIEKFYKIIIPMRTKKLCWGA
jgi:hypothetical protein